MPILQYAVGLPPLAVPSYLLPPYLCITIDTVSTLSWMPACVQIRQQNDGVSTLGRLVSRDSSSPGIFWSFGLRIPSRSRVYGSTSGLGRGSTAASALLEAIRAAQNWAPFRQIDRRLAVVQLSNGESVTNAPGGSSAPSFFPPHPHPHAFVLRRWIVLLTHILFVSSGFMFTLPFCVLVLAHVVLVSSEDILAGDTFTVFTTTGQAKTVEETQAVTLTSTWTGLVTSTSLFTLEPTLTTPNPAAPTTDLCPEESVCVTQAVAGPPLVKLSATLFLIELVPSAPANQVPVTITKTVVSIQPTSTTSSASSSPASSSNTPSASSSTLPSSTPTSSTTALPTSSSSTGSQSRTRSKRTQALVGGLLGALSAVGIALAILFMLRRRRLGRTQQRQRAWQVLVDPEAARAPASEGGGSDSDSGTVGSVVAAVPPQSPVPARTIDNAVNEKIVLRHDDDPQPGARMAVEPLAGEMSSVVDSDGAGAHTLTPREQLAILRARVQELESLRVAVGRPASEALPGYRRFEGEHAAV
ncbi:hypothetical protein C8R46DRAFT_1357675 [Mycena filopes]|nr:hypothetical protein C8R46DRAFT_1357675 [Mycena filopes]